MEIIKILALVLTAALVFSYIAYADEPDLTTFNNARFELILKAEAGEIILNEIESINGEAKEALLDDFRVITLPGNEFINTYLTRGFYLIGGAGEVRKFVYTEELSEVIIPSKKGDRYLLCTGSVPWNLEGSWGTAATRELYDFHNDLIWRHEYIGGYPRASNDLSLVGILRPGVLNVINDKGENTKIEHPGWKTPFFVTSRGDTVILTDIETGTVMLDAKGKKVHNLRTGYHGWIPFSFTFLDAPSYYASSNLIIQLCRKAEVRDHRIQVYNGKPRLLWEKKFPWQEQHGLRFGLSANEEFILICVRLPERKCELYRTKNGAKLREIELTGEDFYWFVECGVTNDGKRCFLTTLNNTNLKSKTFVFENGEKIAEFHTEATENPACNYPLVELSQDGSLIAVSFEKGFSIYRISTD